jgi:hypothetical protein
MRLYETLYYTEYAGEEISTVALAITIHVNRSKYLC